MDFEQYVRERMNPLVRLTWAMCADHQLAEDLVQDVLIKVHRHWDRIQTLDSPDAYVRKALVNEYLSWRRKWIRISPRAEVPAHSWTVADHADAHADRAELDIELAGLPAQQRTVLVLRYYAGLDDNEIAKLLKCGPATVRGYASRALATLKLELNAKPSRSSHAH